MGKVKDESGKRYGYLTVLYQIENPQHNGALWKCQCDCGQLIDVLGFRLRQSAVVSCGCQKKPGKRIDLTGQKIDHLYVLGDPQPGGSAGTKWKCQCECGAIVYRYSHDLLNSNTYSSCGCMNGKRIRKDLTGQNFGKLVAIEPVESDQFGNTFWLCKCACGNKKKVRASSLLAGNTKSCGCITSTGNNEIEKFLLQNNINYIPEYCINDCVTEKGNPMRFDFCILDDDNKIKFLLEYDGEQHFQPMLRGYLKGQYEIIHARDEIKNKYCFEHNIKLIRIGYNEDLNTRLQKIFIEGIYE